MNLSGYIARRYFFAKTSRNAVNIISGISILGVLVGTLSLIIVLSAFNGLEKLVGSFYSTFNPDLKITPLSGKYFFPKNQKLAQISSLPDVASVSGVLEERVLLSYQDKEHIGSIKGVDGSYAKVTDIEDAIRDGEFRLFFKDSVPALVMGAGVAYYLGYSRNAFSDPVQVFVPRAGASAADFNRAFTSRLTYPTGIFTIQPEFDVKYALTNLDFVRELLNQPGALTALEIEASPGADLNKLKRSLSGIMGDDFAVKDRIEQQAVFMKVMKSESLFTFLVFALILGIASFTIMGSLSMMMLDKKEHLRTLWALGSDLPTLRSIFLKEGLLISGAGLILGLVLGVLAVLGQEHFGWIKLGQGYVVEAYPVVLRFRDVLLVSITVAVLGGLSSWLTSRRLNYAFLQGSAK